MSTIKMSVGVERLRSGRTDSALTMGPELMKSNPFQITKIDTIEYGAGSFDVLMSDKGISFGNSSVFGAAVKGSKQLAWEVLLANADKEGTLKQVQDGEVDVDIALADLHFKVTEVNEIKDYNGKNLHTLRSYSGYDVMLKEAQQAVKDDASKKTKDIPTSLNSNDLSSYEKSVIYASDVKTDGTARQLYSLEIDFITEDV